MEMVQHHPAMNPPAAPVCSVCIANYNGAGLLPDCLESILAQQGDFSVEIIVHDDASTDNSLALLQQRYPQVEILASGENVGFSVGNNRMVAHARGEYVLLLNNDAALYPDALATLLNAARCQTCPGIQTLPQYDWISGDLVDRGCLLDPFYNPVPNLDPERSDVAMVIGACLFMPRTLWNSLGGFPEWLESIGEDLYLCCLARLRGTPVQVGAESGYRHRQGASFGGNRVSKGKLHTNLRRRRLSERNKTFALFVLTPGAVVWPLLALHLATLLVEGLLLSMLKPTAHVWSGIYRPTITSPIRYWATLRARRTEAQNTRHAGWWKYMSTTRLWPRKLQLLKNYGLPHID
jgi:GT2 family glycosyltransferase